MRGAVLYPAISVCSASCTQAAQKELQKSLQNPTATYRATAKVGSKSPPFRLPKLGPGGLKKKWMGKNKTHLIKHSKILIFTALSALSFDCCKTFVRPCVVKNKSTRIQFSRPSLLSPNVCIQPKYKYRAFSLPFLTLIISIPPGRRCSLPFLLLPAQVTLVSAAAASVRAIYVSITTIYSFIPHTAVRVKQRHPALRQQQQ